MCARALLGELRSGVSVSRCVRVCVLCQLKVIHRYSARISTAPGSALASERGWPGRKLRFPFFFAEKVTRSSADLLHGNKALEKSKSCESVSFGQEAWLAASPGALNELRVRVSGGVRCPDVKQ